LREVPDVIDVILVKCRSRFVHVVPFLRQDCISGKITLKGHLKIGLVPCRSLLVYELH
jgi:hypothetical protein